MTRQISIEPNRPTAPAHCRTFGLSDAMILIAGVALSMSMGAHLIVLLAQQVGGLGRDAATHRHDVLSHWPVFWRAIHDQLRNTLWYALQVDETIVAGVMLAFVVVRLRRPRPSLGVLLRQTGAVAVPAILVGLFWGTGLLLYAFPGAVDSFTAAPIAVGASVAVAWIVLAASRGREPEPGWLGWLGRSLGGLAILAALLAVATRI
jgi:hypothetical protein